MEYPTDCKKVAILSIDGTRKALSAKPHMEGIMNIVK